MLLLDGCVKRIHDENLPPRSPPTLLQDWVSTAMLGREMAAEHARFHRHSYGLVEVMPAFGRLAGPVHGDGVDKMELGHEEVVGILGCLGYCHSYQLV